MMKYKNLIFGLNENHYRLRNANDFNTHRVLLHGQGNFSNITRLNNDEISVVCRLFFNIPTTFQSTEIIARQYYRSEFGFIYK